MASGIHTPSLEFIQATPTGTPHNTAFFLSGSHPPNSQRAILLHASAMFSWLTQLIFTAQSSLTPTLFKTRLSLFARTVDRRHAGWNPNSDPEGISGQTYSSSTASLQRRAMGCSAEAREINQGAKHLSHWKWSEGGEAVSGYISVDSFNE